MNLNRKRFLSVFICLAGGVLLYGTFARDYDQRRIAVWPTVDGHVLDDSVYSAYFNRHQVFRQHISYEYSIQGASYIGNRLYTNRFNEGLYWQTELDALQDLPAIGSEITVHYNPAAPSEAVLYILPLSDETYWFQIFSGLGLLGTGLLFLPSIFRRETEVGG
jgi:hypothetical protein